MNSFVKKAPGSISTAVNLGWDWFALQLDDGREAMLFIVRQGTAQLLVGASLTDADCITTAIAPQAVSVTALGQWTSPHTLCTYPAGWEVTIGAETFTVAPVLSDQEVVSLPPLPTYWEGAATVGGSAIGRAYVELQGYCP